MPDYLIATTANHAYHLPRDLPSLMARLHGRAVDSGGLSRVEFPNTHLPCLEAALREWRRFREENPLSIEGRFEPAPSTPLEASTDSEMGERCRLLPEESEPRAAMDLAEMAEKYGLQRPPPLDKGEEVGQSGVVATNCDRDSGGVKSGTEFKLIGRVEDFRESDEDEN